MAWPGPTRLSIRARLALTITALTAVIGLAAVWGGLRAFEDQIRRRAVTERVDGVVEQFELTLEAGAEEFTVEADEIFFPGIIIADEGEIVEGDGLEGGVVIDEVDGGEVYLDSTEVLAEWAQLTLAELDEVGLADPLVEAFGDDQGRLNVVLFDTEVVTLDHPPVRTEGDELLVRALDEVPDDVVLVLLGDLEELRIVSFEQFETAPTAVTRDLETVVEEVAGRRLGLLVDVTDELAALDGIRTSLWTAAAGLTALAGLATWLLTSRALRPVAAITDQVDEITSGTLDGRVPEVASNDEVGVLARTMNRMLGRLERSELQRRQFVSDASHELRTPVAVLRSEAEVAHRAPATTTVGDFAAVVLNETARLEGLVEDLLALARSDEGRLATGPGRVSTGPAEIDVDDVVLDEAGRTRRLPVDRSQVSAGQVRAKADDLARAVGHLLDNAARHGEAAVSVGVRTEGDTVRVWVEDDGAGIAETDRARVLERFVRLDEARSRDRGGSGLGLAVVTETANALGGTVEIDQSPLGGARVTMLLPAA